MSEMTTEKKIVDIRVAAEGLETLAQVYNAWEDVELSTAPVPPWVTMLDAQLPESDLTMAWRTYKAIEAGGVAASFETERGLDVTRVDIAVPDITMPTGEGFDLGLELMLWEEALYSGLVSELSERELVGAEFRALYWNEPFGSEGFRVSASYRGSVQYKGADFSFDFASWDDASDWKAWIQKHVPSMKAYVDAQPDWAANKYGVRYSDMGDQFTVSHHGRIGEPVELPFVDSADPLAAKGFQFGWVAVYLESNQFTWEAFDLAISAYVKTGLVDLKTPSKEDYDGYDGGIEDYSYGILPNGNIEICGDKEFDGSKINGCFEYDRNTFKLVGGVE